MFKNLKKWFQSRRSNLEETTKSLGLDYNSISPLTVFNELALFELRHERQDWEIHNVISASDESVTTKLMAFDLQYEKDTSYTDSDGHYHHRTKTVGQTVLFTSKEGIYLPQMKIRPEGLWDKIAELFVTNNDIDFESNPLFSKRYFVEGHSEEDIRAAIDDEFMQLLEKTKNWSIATIDNKMLLYEEGRFLKGEEIEPLLHFIAQLYYVLSLEKTV